ncbi:MAG: aminoglycoside phosphotransferase family protein [Pseudomonadota bacterium]
MNIFERNILGIYGEFGKIWLKDLPQIIAKYSNTWNLTNLEPVKNLSYNYVLSGLQNGNDVILKLSPDSNALLREKIALGVFQGHGGVEIISYTDDALLLKRVMPGYSLQKNFPSDDEECIKIACDVMSRLHQSMSLISDFPDLRSLFKTLDKDLGIEDRYLLKARQLRDKLLAMSVEQVFLHGDLHQDNILKDAEGWSAIDPKGIIGDPVYEATAFIRNPITELAATPNASDIIARRIVQCSEYFDISPFYLTEWCFCQSVLSLAWCLEDNTEAAHDVKMVEIMYNITHPILK